MVPKNSSVEVWEGWEGGVNKRHEEILVMMDMFTILIVAMVSQVCACKTWQLYTSTMHSLLYVNYTSINLIGKRKKRERNCL